MLIPSGHTDTNASFQVGQAAVGALDQILRNLFADDDLVRSHFLHVGATSPAGHAKAMPLALSELAADRAGDYWGLLHHQEHELDTVDAFCAVLQQFLRKDWPMGRYSWPLISSSSEHQRERILFAFPRHVIQVVAHHTYN